MNTRGIAGCFIVGFVLSMVGLVAVIREAARILMPFLIWIDTAGR